MKDTALVRMTINELAKINNISLDDAFSMFYESKLCKMLSDRETGLFTYAPKDLALLVENLSCESLSRNKDIDNNLQN